jgi:hypothetical protein
MLEKTNSKPSTPRINYLKFLRNGWIKLLRATDDPERQKLIKERIDELEEEMYQ